MSYFAESLTSIVLIIFVWFICMISVKILETCIIIIKKLFNNYSRNTRISPNYDMTTNSLDNNTEITIKVVKLVIPTEPLFICFINIYILSDLKNSNLKCGIMQVRRFYSEKIFS